MFEELVERVAAARSPSARVGAWAAVENAACAARLAAMADMLAAAYAANGSQQREQWRFDNWAAVCAHIGAAQGVTSGVASGLLMDAVALAERLPKVAALFAAGVVSHKVVHMVCARTAMVKGADAVAAVDDAIAARVHGLGTLSMVAAEQAVDAVVLQHDPYAVRRTTDSARGHRVDVSVDDASGTAWVSASVTVTDGLALDKRADLLARTVCAHDPRDLNARRSAALGAMGFGWDRLPCLCEREDCDATTRPAVGGVVIHVVAREDTVARGGNVGPAPDVEPDPEPELDPQPDSKPQPDPEPGAPDEPASDTPATPAPPWAGELDAQRRALTEPPTPLFPKPWYTYSCDGLVAHLAADPGEFCPAAPGMVPGGPVIPAPVVAQIAIHARIDPLVHPGQCAAHAGYRPPKRLADFVRCRDGTCRFPGCTRAAMAADIDHTVPAPYGPTAASNLACLCRIHHLCKTFWPGWTYVQAPDATVTWTAPDGQTYRTLPDSHGLFPELCAPAAPSSPTVPVGTVVPPDKHTAGLTMPKRRSTRAQDRARRIDAHRQANAQWAERHGAVSPVWPRPAA